MRTSTGRPRLLRVPGITVAACVLATAFASSSRAAAPTGHGTVEFRRMAAPSIHDSKRSVRVYLPASYNQPEARARRYPVIYLLHGWPGGNGNWPGSGRADITLDSLIADGRIPEVIVLMPDGNGIGLLGRSLYLNSYDGASRMEDFVVRDLVAWADSSFRTRRVPWCRAIIGLSDGGLAAVNLSFKHPEIFGACGSHSGTFRLEPEVGTGRILGPEPGAARIRKENSPLFTVDQVVSKIQGMSIYFDCGTDDDEIEGNREFHDKLTLLRVPHTYKEFPGGHGWGYWRKALRESLIAVTSRMR